MDNVHVQRDYLPLPARAEILPTPEESVSNSSQYRIIPEYIRFPKPRESEPYTGLKRSQLYEMASSRVIQTVTLRRRGRVRGTRLIIASTLLDYLHKLATEQNPPTASDYGFPRPGEDVR